MTICEFLAWDSAFFGLRIARVNDHRLSAERCCSILDWCAANQINCLYFLADTDHPETIRLAEANQFQLVDIRVTLERRITLPPGPLSVYGEGEATRAYETDTQKRVPTNDAVGTPFWASARPIIRLSRPDDVDTLVHISRDAYTQSRFYNDPRFSPEKSSLLYQTWIRRSCLEGYADAVWVAEHEGQPAGYVTCKLDHEQREGSISLFGLAEQARGQGVGQALVDYALGWFAAQRMERVSVATQGSNIAAQRLYQKCGFLTRAVQLWYHRWFENKD
jgi:dTDP-4-amino-4,6-dideoxy-D-galactose acyltransferase